MKGGRNERGSSVALNAAIADRKDRCDHHEGLLPEGPVEQTPVAGLEHAHEPGVAMAQAPHLRQQVVAKDWGQGDRGDEAGEDRDDVGHAQRREQPPLDAGEREQGDEHQDNDGGGVDDARAHLLGRLGDDGKRRRRLRLGPVLAQAPEHVLDADDGVVDQLADGDRESAQRHRIDGEAEQLKDDHRHQHGYRNGRQRNERRAPVHQEQEQDHGDDDEGLDQNSQHIVDRDLDERSLPKQHVDGGDALRQDALEIAQGGLNLPGQLEGVGVGLFLNAKDDGGIAHVSGVAAFDTRRIVHRGDLTEPDCDPLAIGNSQGFQVLQAGRAGEIANEILAPMLVDEAARAVGAELPERGLDLAARDVEARHLREVERHAVLAHLPADGDDLGHAGDGEQPGTDHPVDDLPDLHGTCGVAGHGDQHDLAHDRGHGRHLRTGVAGQLLAHHAKPFCDLLPVEVDIGAPVELDVDDGQAHARDRAHAHDPRHAVHRRLQRERDELLDLFRGQALGLGHQSDGRPVEVGEDVHRQTAQRDRAIDDEDERCRQHEQAVAQARPRPAG